MLCELCVLCAGAGAGVGTGTDAGATVGVGVCDAAEGLVGVVDVNGLSGVAGGVGGARSAAPYAVITCGSLGTNTCMPSALDNASTTPLFFPTPPAKKIPFKPSPVGMSGFVRLATFFATES